MGAVSSVFTAMMIFFVVILGLAAPFFAIFLIIRAMGRGSTGASLTVEEMGLVQEIHANMAEMEKRIEALETILLGKME